MAIEKTRKMTLILGVVFVFIIALGAALKGDISIIWGGFIVFIVYLLILLKNKRETQFSLLEKALIFIFLLLIAILPVLLFKWIGGTN